MGRNFWPSEQSGREGDNHADSGKDEPPGLEAAEVGAPCCAGGSTRSHCRELVENEPTTDKVDRNREQSAEQNAQAEPAESAGATRRQEQRQRDQCGAQNK